MFLLFKMFKMFVSDFLILKTMVYESIGYIFGAIGYIFGAIGYIFGAIGYIFGAIGYIFGAIGRNCSVESPITDEFRAKNDL